MRTLSGLALFCGLAAGGCPAPPQVCIELCNTTGLELRPELYVSAESADPDVLLAPANRVTDLTDRPLPELRPGQSVQVCLPCGAAAGIGSQDATLFDPVRLEVIRSPDRPVLARGADYDCGATVRLTYRLDADGVLRVEVEVF